jgi:hypothetical protein
VGGIDFSGSHNPYQISGWVYNGGGGIPGVTITVGSLQLTTDANGLFDLYVTPGTYTFTASKPGYTFNPSPQSVTITNAGKGISFFATPTGPQARSGARKRR